MYSSNNLKDASVIQSQIEKLLRTKELLRDNRLIEFNDVTLFRGYAYDPKIPASIPNFQLNEYPEIILFLEELIQKDIDKKTREISVLLQDKK